MMLGYDIKATLFSLLNEAWSNKSIPQSWNDANVVAIFKKGDTSDLANFRPISRLSVLYEIYEAMIQ